MSNSKILNLTSIVVVAATLTSFLLCPPIATGQQPSNQIRGFTSNGTVEQRRLEDKFKRVPSPEASEKHLRILTEEPHLAGTKEDRNVVNYIVSQLKGYGLEPEIVEYFVYLPYPKLTSLRMIEPTFYRAVNKEEGIEIDKDSYDSRVLMPSNGYSASGDIKAQLVYANYGLLKDYKKLDELGINVKDKIVIVRYGKSYRGVKVKVAEEHGALGVLIYSDPQDDGYAKGDVYPRGPWRPPSGVQRGSVKYMTAYPGDPLTPGWASTKNARRLKPEEAKSLPKIPAMPISYHDATKLLESLAGPVVPRGWQGGLPFTYHVGPGATKVHLKVEMDYQIRPIWNVLTTIRGTEEPDEIIVLGNHHDAWVYGAVDPSSGTTALLEMSKGLGQLLKDGFRPKRTLVLAAWDGEEFGLLGSTEWGEDKADLLRKKCVAYVNVDVGVNGEHFSAGAVGSLKTFLRELAKDIIDPKTEKTLHQAWLEHQKKERDQTKEEGKVVEADEKNIHISPLGSGSDFTVFLDHLGIPTIDMGFGGDYGVYHSVFDSFTWMKLFGDPTWRYHSTMAQIWGLVALRLSQADVLPFDFAEYGSDIEKFATKLQKNIDDESKENLLALHANTQNMIRSNLDLIKQEAKKMNDLGTKINDRISEALLRDDRRSFFTQLNGKFVQVEHDLTSARGLPNREWFKHLIYAPGFYTGYESKPLPGVSEAIDNKDWKTFEEQAKALLEALSRANATLTKAVGLN